MARPELRGQPRVALVAESALSNGDLLRAYSALRDLQEITSSGRSAAAI